MITELTPHAQALFIDIKMFFHVVILPIVYFKCSLSVPDAAVLPFSIALPRIL